MNLIFKPVVLRTAFFDTSGMPAGIRLVNRVVYDYEVEYYLKSNGGIEINGDFVKFEAGDINFRKPGQEVCGVASYECYIVCLDLMGNTDKAANYVLGTPEQAQPLYYNSLISKIPDKISSSSAHKLGEIITEIYRNSIFNDELSVFTIRTLGYVLLNELLSYSAKNNNDKQIKDKKINDAVNFIHLNYSEQIEIKELIEKSGYKKAQFYKLFKHQTGTTPNMLITDLRINQAKNLLLLTDNDIAEIADSCGYADNVYFSCLFKKYTGIQPSQYRQRSGG